MIKHCAIELSPEKKESFLDVDSFPFTFLLLQKVPKKELETNYGRISGKGPDLAIVLL